jgi:hypothetical protein
MNKLYYVRHSGYVLFVLIFGFGGRYVVSLSRDS